MPPPRKAARPHEGTAPSDGRGSRPERGRWSSSSQQRCSGRTKGRKAWTAPLGDSVWPNKSDLLPCPIESVEGAWSLSFACANPARERGDSGFVIRTRQSGVCQVEVTERQHAPEPLVFSFAPPADGRRELVASGTRSGEPHATRRVGVSAARAKNPAIPLRSKVARTTAPRREADGER